MVLIHSNSARKVVGVLILTLLTPFLHGLVLPPQAGGAACRMSCCKKKAQASCHKSEPGDSQTDLRWTASPKCPKGCAQRIGLPGSVHGTLAAGQLEAGPVAQKSLLSRRPNPARGQTGTERALFERPPPSLL